jgi:hypothetical protein
MRHLDLRERRRRPVYSTDDYRLGTEDFYNIFYDLDKKVVWSDISPSLIGVLLKIKNIKNNYNN